MLYEPNGLNLVDIYLALKQNSWKLIPYLYIMVSWLLKILKNIYIKQFFLILEQFFLVFYIKNENKVRNNSFTLFSCYSIQNCNIPT